MANEDWKAEAERLSAELENARKLAEDEYEIRCAEERTTAALRAQISELTNGIDVAAWMLENMDKSTLGAERDRLRAALEQIASADLGVGKGRYDLIEIAVQALNPALSHSAEGLSDGT